MDNRDPVEQAQLDAIRQSIKLLGSAGCSVLAAAELIRIVGCEIAHEDLCDIAEAIAARCSLLENAHYALDLITARSASSVE